MISYKFDVLESLKACGWSTYRLRKEKKMGEYTIQQIREKKLVSWKEMNTLCELLNCQPGDLLEYKKAGE